MYRPWLIFSIWLWWRLHNAQKNCDVNAHCCVELDGGFDCLCKPGFGGNGRTCSDENECASSVIQMLNVSIWLVITVVSALRVSKEMERHVSIWTNKCALGIDTCDSNEECSNTDSGFTYICNAGFVGDGMTCTCNAKNEWTQGATTPFLGKLCSWCETIATST
jgi:hypothetical protein